MSQITSSYESKHGIVTLTISSLSTEAHSLLSEKRREFTDVVTTIASGYREDEKASETEQLSALASLRDFDTLVAEHIKRKG